MPRGKATINRDSVFRGGTHTEAVPATPQGIKPVEDTKHQTGVWLSDQEVDWLDSRCQEIRRAGWRSVTRSALIRAMIQASMEANIEVAGVSGEEELAQRLTGNKQ